jgi:hypothetical protein
MKASKEHGVAQPPMRDPATPQMRALAARLVAHEAAVGSPADVHTPAAYRVFEKLGQPLTTLAGAAGFRSLLSRALMIAQREAPHLSEVRVNAEGSLEDPGHVPSQENRNGDPKTTQDAGGQRADGGLVLAAELLGLLYIFIGEAITLRLVRDIWPNASVLTTESGSLSLSSLPKAPLVRGLAFGSASSLSKSTTDRSKCVPARREFIAVQHSPLILPRADAG